ncbi:hypothetical protein MHBO_003805 [Bonamia ostreae]|uniref:Uncharacterized protein n=1 Tax=Bonamia ostreae TaxID=126728 RepID=A0ABV2ARJ7_9EUKA
MSKTFKNNKELLKSGNLEKFLQIFDEKTDFLVTKKINSIYNELKFETSNLWENRCANTKCLKTSKFQSFCDKCGNAQTLQKIKSEQKEIGLNFNFSQNEKIKMIEKSFDIILEMTRKQKSKNKIRRNGGDIVFLLRNVLINASAKIKKTTKLAFDEIMKKIRKVTKLHDNSNPSVIKT